MLETTAINIGWKLPKYWVGQKKSVIIKTQYSRQKLNKSALIGFQGDGKASKRKACLNYEVNSRKLKILEKVLALQKLLRRIQKTSRVPRLCPGVVGLYKDILHTFLHMILIWVLAQLSKMSMSSDLFQSFWLPWTCFQIVSIMFFRG